MSAITPDTDVILLKVPLEITQDNQLTFSNATAQYNYFHNLPRLELEDFTYQRKDGVIRCGILADDLYQYNYVMYRNNGFSNKWFYAFIDKVEYLNHNTSAISIRTDVWQCWQFDLDYKPTFVEREHVNDDTIGAHTVKENLEVGELIDDNSSVYSFAVAPAIGFLVSSLPTGRSLPDYNKSLFGVYSGYTTFFVMSATDADKILEIFRGAFGSDPSYGIQSIFIVPSTSLTTLYPSSTTWNYSGSDIRIYFPSGSYTNMLATYSHDVTRPSTLDGYTPKNNKMFTKEFCMIQLTNGCGLFADYYWENFANKSTANFKTYSVLGQGCEIKTFPQNYKGISTEPPEEATASETVEANTRTWDYAIDSVKLPICGWTTDYFTTWVLNNGVSFASNALEKGIATGTSVAEKNWVGTASNALSLTADLVQTGITLGTTPDFAHGSTTSISSIVSGKKAISFKVKTCRAEMAKICDDFLSKFGYKVNEVKVPNVTGRTNWNYVKTIDCYIKADIPQEDLKEIKDMFNNGVTFWHNPATFADYSQNNAIV